MKFEYHQPTTIADAISISRNCQGMTRWLGGGTELLPKLKQRALSADHLINLKRIPGLRDMTPTESNIRIGPLVTLEELSRSNFLNKRLAALLEAAGGVASPNIRRAATIGGNLCQAPNCLYFIHRNLWGLPECYALGGRSCNAIKGARKCTAMSPVDTAPALMALAAELEIEGLGRKKIPLESFFVTSGITALEKAEMITSIIIPNSPSYSGAAYLKYSQRKTIDYGIVSAAAWLALEPGKDYCMKARVALGGMDTVPLRAIIVEEALAEERMTEKMISKAGELAAGVGHPTTDIHASTSYRRHLASVLVEKTLSMAFERARAVG